MKIEPIRKALIPKYAAALAAAAAAVMLTGCQTAGDVAIAGDIAVEEQSSLNAGMSGDELRLEGEATPDPSIENSEDDLRLDGKVVMATRPANGEGLPATPGTANVDTDCSDCDDSSEVMLEGDVAVMINYADSLEEIAGLPDDRVKPYKDAFAAAGLEMESVNEPLDFSGYEFRVRLINAEKNIRVVFFDGYAEGQEGYMWRWVEKRCTNLADWGALLIETPNDDSEKQITVFVDISHENNNAAELAAKIAKDVAKR